MSRIPRERPMPERPRLEPPPDFIPEVIVEHLQGACARREPPAHSRPFALDPPVLRIYTEHRVKAHERCVYHWPTEVNRFGDGWCRCGARMWSPWWVADGLYGLAAALSGTKVKVVAMPEGDEPIEEIDDALDGTASWIAATEEIWVSKLEREDKQ